MSTLTAPIVLEDVTGIPRRGMGRVYRAALSVFDVGRAVKRGIVKYSPVYQRGFKKKELETIKKDEWDLLLPLNHPKLQLDPDRAMQMAVKFLDGRLYTSHITWNARADTGSKEPTFDEEERTLTLEDVDITVPDTAHRHLAYYYLGVWKDDPDEIPSLVVVDGKPVERKTIKALLDKFDPKKEFVYVEIYHLEPKREGYLYDEFNSDLKPPSNAVAIDLNPEKTPSRRFVSNLMRSCTLFGRDQIETRSNTIGSKSRKLTTNATLEAAVRPMTKRLAELEGKPAGDDLVKFVSAFFEELAKLFPAYLPEATARDRQDLREKTFAVSNVMFFPLFHIAFDLWEDFHAAGKDWNSQASWKTALRKIGGSTPIEDPKDRKRLGRDTIEVMSRDNPSWIGTLLSRKYDENGKMTGYVLTNNFQTREASYNYLCRVAGIRPKGFSPKRTKKNGQNIHEK